jgi:hypothetical protein
MNWLRCIGYVLTLRCEEADRIRTRIALDEATFTERLAERLHRFVCSACRNVRKQLQILDGAIRDLDETAGDGEMSECGDQCACLSDDARARIAASLQKDFDSPARD